MKSRGGRQGSILLMSLFLVLVIGLVGRAVIMLGPGALALSDSSVTRAQAQRVAESGLEYAVSKLRDNSNWRGSDDRITVNLPGLVVREDAGNVFGLLTDSQGNVSQFRLRFNYQDGNPGADTLPDPSAENFLTIPFVCMNNLKGTSEIFIPRADEGSGKVTKPEQGPHLLPKGGVYLLVEGRAGRGLNQHQPEHINAPVTGPVSRYLAETYLESTVNDADGRASMMGGGDIAFKLARDGEVSIKVRNQGANSATPRLRSKGSVTVDTQGAPGTLTIDQGEVGRDENKPPGFSATVDGSVSLTQESVGDGKDFFNLKWADVVKADSNPNAVQLPGGTYVHWDNGTTHYYDMALGDYQAYMAVGANQSDPGQVLSSDCKEVRPASNLGVKGLNVAGRRNPYTGAWSSSWEISADFMVNASPKGVESLAVIPRSGANYSPSDASDVVALTSPDRYTTDSITFSMKGATVSANDDLTIFARLNGKDSTITSAGNLKVITKDVEMESESKDEGKGGAVVPTMQLNLYVKKDIRISTFDGKDFKELKLEGLIYSWGNFTALLGDAGLDRWGEFKLDGALVAYGGDPETGSPGSAGNGRIDVSARKAEITWDDRRMAGISTLGTTKVTLRRSLYNCP